MERPQFEATCAELINSLANEKIFPEPITVESTYKFDYQQYICRISFLVGQKKSEQIIIIPMTVIDDSQYEKRKNEVLRNFKIFVKNKENTYQAYCGKHPDKSLPREPWTLKNNDINSVIN